MKELEQKIKKILDRHDDYILGGDINDDLAKEIASLLRSELIAYDVWMVRKYWGRNIPTPREAVDEYLKQKKSE